MKQDSKGTYHEFEFVIELKKKLSSKQRKKIEEAIKNSKLFHRTYKLEGDTWHELRNSKNRDLQKEPNVSLLINPDSIYMMRETDSVWENLSELKECLKDDLNKVSNYKS